MFSLKRKKLDMNTVRPAIEFEERVIKKMGNGEVDIAHGYFRVEDYGCPVMKTGSVEYEKCMPVHKYS